MKKLQLIKRLTNQGYNLQVMAIHRIKEFLRDGRHFDDKARNLYEAQQAEKNRILRRIMDSNLRFLGQAFRQALHFTQSEIDKDRMRAFKQRGICRRIIDSGARQMGMALNALK